MNSSSKFCKLKGLERPILKREDHGTRKGVLNQIYEILDREYTNGSIKNIINDSIDQYSDLLNYLLDDLYSKDIELLFWYKINMVEYLDELFESNGTHFGLEDRLLILNSNPR